MYNAKSKDVQGKASENSTRMRQRAKEGGREGEKRRSTRERETAATINSSLDQNITLCVHFMDIVSRARLSNYSNGLSKTIARLLYARRNGIFGQFNRISKARYFSLKL